MKNFVSYPAIFHSDEDGFRAKFPDLPGCHTQGRSLEEVVLMAQDALGLFLLDETTYPEPSNPTDYKLDSGAFVCFITLDMLEYKKKYNSKAIKKTLTIPQWLNTAAEKQNVNFSKVLQDALIEKLHLH